MSLAPNVLDEHARVAIVHYWLIGMRGGERVLEALCRLFPDAHIYTHVVDRSKLSRTILRHEIRTTFIGRLPFARRLYQKYLPLMPLALEALDLTGYDLVISSEAGPAKGVVTHPEALHVTYCHSPMRYIWDQYPLYRKSAGALTRVFMAPIAHYLRIWDTVSATRSDVFIANSRFVAARIKKFYGRAAAIVHPPVDVDAFQPVAKEERGDFYLWCGELVRYKRPDLVIAAFAASGRKLIVIGDGPESRELIRSAPATITFLGRASFAAFKDHLARCRALVFAGEEDFGIVPVEAQASGRPVIAWDRGGVRDTVIDGETGMLFADQTVASLNAALDRFEASDLEHVCLEACRRNARRFDHPAFAAGFRKALVDVARPEAMLGGSSAIQSAK